MFRQKPKTTIDANTHKLKSGLFSNIKGDENVVFFDLASSLFALKKEKK